MSAKRKLLISLLSMVFILLAVAATVAIVFALTQQNVKTSLNIEYTVEDIDGSVYATYTIGGTTNYLEPIADAEHVSADNKSLIFKVTDTESAGNLMFPEGQLPLTAQNDNIVIQYTYSNTGVKHYIASMSFDSELEYSNMKVEYSINGEDYSENRYAVVVPAFSTGKSYWIRISIDDKAQDASFTGDFNWLLSGCDPQSKEYLSLTSLEMQATGTAGEYQISVASSGEYAGNLVIPDNVNGDPVTTLAANYDLTDEEKKQVTSIYIPASVETIESEAFSGYTNLQTVIFEEYSQLTNIEDWAFENCTSLTSIEIPDGVTYIGMYSFSWCTGLTSIEIPDGVTSISDCAFYKCTSLTSIVIPDSVTSISYEAFANTGLISIEIPEGVFISGSAFANCKDLTSVTIGSGVNIDTWEENPFHGCTNLKNVTLETMHSTVIETFGELGSENGEMHITIGNSVSSIAEPGLFSGYSGITSIEVAEGNTVYHSSGNCVIETASKTLVLACGKNQIPTDGSVTSIGNYACWGKPDNIVIPASVTSIGMGAFAFCELTSLEVASGNTKYHSAGNCVIETASNTLVAACNTSVIPTDGSVTSIGDYAFAFCTGLTSIEIPDSITSIGNASFGACIGLTSIVIPESVTSIGQYAFSLCQNLTSVTFENTVGWKIEDVEGDEGIQDVSSDVLTDPALLAQTLVEGTNYVWTRS